MNCFIRIFNYLLNCVKWIHVALFFGNQIRVVYILKGGVSISVVQKQTEEIG